MADLAELSRLRKEVAASETAERRLRGALERSEDRLAKATEEIRQMRVVEADRLKEIAKLRRALEQEHGQRESASKNLAETQDRLRRVESRLAVGRPAEVLAETVHKSKAELRVLREEKQRLEEHLAAREEELRAAGDEIRSLVAALELRADELLGDRLIDDTVGAAFESERGTRGMGPAASRGSHERVGAARTLASTRGRSASRSPSRGRSRDPSPGARAATARSGAASTATSRRRTLDDLAAGKSGDFGDDEKAENADDDDDTDDDEDDGLRRGRGGGRDADRVGGYGAALSSSVMEAVVVDRVEDEAVILATKLAQYPSRRARKVALLFEIGRRKEAERRLASQLAQRNERVAQLESQSVRLTDALDTARREVDALTERAARADVATEEERARAQRAESALADARRERDAALDFIEDQARAVAEAERAAREATAARTTAEREARAAAVVAQEQQALRERLERVQRSTEEALGRVRQEGHSEEARAAAAEARVAALEAQVRELHGDLEDLTAAHRTSEDAHRSWQARAEEAERALRDARAEAQAAARAHETQDAAVREVDATLRRELERTLDALATTAAERDAVRSQLHDALAALSASDVARRGLEQQVGELTSALASARQARALLQSSLTDQLMELRGRVQAERRAREAAESERARLAGHLRLPTEVWRGGSSSSGGSGGEGGQERGGGGTGGRVGGGDVEGEGRVGSSSGSARTALRSEAFEGGRVRWGGDVGDSDGVPNRDDSGGLPSERGEARVGRLTADSEEKVARDARTGATSRRHDGPEDREDMEAGRRGAGVSGVRVARPLADVTAPLAALPPSASRARSSIPAGTSSSPSSPSQVRSPTTLGSAADLADRVTRAIAAAAAGRPVTSSALGVGRSLGGSRSRSQGDVHGAAEGIDREQRVGRDEGDEDADGVVEGRTWARRD